MFKNINYGVLLVEILPINWLKNWGYHQEVSYCSLIGWLHKESLLLPKVSTNGRTLTINLLNLKESEKYLSMRLKICQVKKQIIKRIKIFSLFWLFDYYSLCARNSSAEDMTHPRLYIETSFDNFQYLINIHVKKIFLS